jgi:hypothetical protein
MDWLPWAPARTTGSAWEWLMKPACGGVDR